MKKFIVLLLLFLGSTSLIFAQKTSPLPPKKSTPSSTSATVSVTSRINDIRDWYAEIQSIGLKNCNSKTYTEYELAYYDENGKPIKSPYDQTIKRCRLTPTYSLFIGEFGGHEWGENVRIYLKNEKIFFVYISGGAEGYSYEIRYYCNEDERIIKELKQEADGGEQLSGANMEVNTNINKDIRSLINFGRFNWLQ